MANRIKALWERIRPTKRKLIQIYAALLYNAHLKGFIKGEIYTGAIKNICVPGLNCYSCPGAVGACPLGALQNALASSGARAPWYVLGILMLLGLTLGRTICGWLCPFGLIQELVHKLPTPKLQKNRVTHVLSYLKYVILALFAVAIPFIYSAQGIAVPGFCKYICPAGTLEGAIALLSVPENAPKMSMLGILFTRKFVILVLIVLACVFIYRAFCRFLCPLGAIYGLFARLSLLGVKVEADKCTKCGRCVRSCKMDVRCVGDHGCIHCGKCISECAAGAIEWRFGSVRLAPHTADRTPEAKKARRVRKVVAWVCALIVLTAVIWFVNRPGTPTESAAAELQQIEDEAPVEDDTPVGSEVGMRCPSFEVPLYGGEGQTFSVDACRGKPVVLNFWATWCGPCVKELPNFQAIAEQYGDQIEVVAIHAKLVTDDVQAFIEKQGLSMNFAQDTDGSVIASLGGSTMLPMTVVLDADGKIVFNEIRAMTLEELQALIDPLLNKG